MSPRPNHVRFLRLLGPVLILAIYATLVIVANGLRFEIRKDERFFWPVVQQFAAQFPPPLALICDYDSPTTPLLFLFLGSVEHLTGGGIILARLICLNLSLAISLTIAWPRPDSTVRPALAALGLMLCPYFLGASIHVYTDILASFLGCMGILAFTRSRHVLAALCFALAISTRQYMVAFPLAICAPLFFPTHNKSIHASRSLNSTLPYILSAASLLFWFALFGGTAPRTSGRTHLSTDAAGALHPEHALYFLSCIGAYFAIPDLIIFRNVTGWRTASRISSLLVGILVIIAFALWPPLGNDPNAGVESMGYLDKSLRWFLSDRPRIIVLALLAWLCLSHILQHPLALALVLLQAATLLKSHIAWDKYALPVLVALWLLQAEDYDGRTTSGRSATTQSDIIMA
ncbi:MAG: hypothetical protein AAB385_10405 [Planctomycetota bacterium]